MVEKVKSRPIEEGSGIRFSIGPEKDRGGKDSLETLDHSLVIPSVGREMEEAQHLGAMRKLHRAALLLYRQCRDPDGNEAILTEGQSVVRMGDNVKEEIAIAPAMDELGGRRSPEREPAENKWTGIERTPSSLPSG